MAVRNPVLSELQEAEECHLQPVGKGDDFIRVDFQRMPATAGYIGTDKTEICLADQVAESFGAGIKLVVPHCAEVEPDGIHQVNHRKALLRELVIHRITGLVIACGDEKQIWINTPEAVNDPRQLREIVDCSMHVIDGEDYRLAVIRSNSTGRCCNGGAALFFHVRGGGGVPCAAAREEEPGGQDDNEQPDQPGSLFAS